MRAFSGIRRRMRPVGRSGVAVLVGLVVLTGCSGPSPPGDDASPTAPSGEVPGPGGSVDPGPGQEAPTTPSPTSPKPGSGTPTPAPSGTQGTTPAEAFSPSGPVGGYARLLLRPDLSSGIRVEVVAQDGAGPSPGVLEALRDALGEVTGKAVTLSGPSPVARAESPWTATGIRQLAPGPSAVGGSATVRLAFLAGQFADDDGVLGVAVNSSTAAVFTEGAAASAGLLGDPARIELAVATHELGHLLGLVDLVLRTGREDPEHPGHSPNRGSVMFWAVESDLISSLLGGSPPTTFDDADRADLAAIARSAG